MLAANLELERPVSAWRGVAVILLASCLLGGMAVSVRVASRAMPALQIAFVRFAGSLLILLLATRGRRLRPRPGNVIRLLQRGLLGAGSICLYYLGIQGAGAGLATVIHCTYPVWTVLLASIFLGERVSSRVLGALAMNLIGVAGIIGPAAAHHAQITWGAACAVGASILAGGAVAMAQHLRASEDATLITTYFMAVGAAVTLPAMHGGTPPMSAGLVAALICVVLTSVAGQWLLHHGLGYTSATQGSLAAATTAISTAMLEGLTLGEHLGAYTFAGAVLMLIAVSMTARDGSTARGTTGTRSAGSTPLG